MSTTFSDEAKLLARGSAWLVVVGLLTGALVSGAMTGKIPAGEHAMLASHLNALLGAFWMLGVAWSMPMLRYGKLGRARIAWSLLVANYANWIITALKSFLHVAGVDYTGVARNDAIFALLVVFVIAPSLAASIAWALGFGTPARNAAS
jgi:hydroxylaminobenzene mutase